MTRSDSPVRLCCVRIPSSLLHGREQSVHACCTLSVVGCMSHVVRCMDSVPLRVLLVRTRCAVILTVNERLFVPYLRLFGPYLRLFVPYLRLFVPYLRLFGPLCAVIRTHPYCGVPRYSPTKALRPCHYRKAEDRARRTPQHSVGSAPLQVGRRGRRVLRQRRRLEAARRDDRFEMRADHEAAEVLAARRRIDPHLAVPQVIFPLD